MDSARYFSKKHKLARNWAAKGFHVFPIYPGGKAPMCANGLYDATTDTVQIDEWWSECPEANIGCSPDASGHMVLDVDDKGDKHGSDTLTKLDSSGFKIPDTLTIRTPSGGRHLWFKGKCKSTVQKVGPALDTRGIGGYVILPGSEVGGGRYSTLRSVDIVETPTWIYKRLSQRTRDSESAVTEQFDRPQNLKRAQQYLEDLVANGAVAVEGEGGSDQAYKVAADLHDIGLTEETAIEMFLEHYNPHCIPPWTEEELTDDEHHSPIRNAFEYAQNEAGSKALDVNPSDFAGIKRKHRQQDTARDPSTDEFRVLGECDQDALPEPEWVIPGWFQERTTVMLYGPPASYKSFIALDLALAFASGRSALGIDYPPTAPKPVVYIAGEGVHAVAKLRRPAWRAHNDVQTSLPFYVIGSSPRMRQSETVQHVVDNIEAAGITPSLIIFDTMSRFLAGTNENDAEVASLAIEVFEQIKVRWDCIVLVLHHSGKDGEKSRGSSVFPGGFDTVIKCEKDEKNKEIVTLTMEKQKDAEEIKPWTMKRKKVLKSLVFEHFIPPKPDVEAKGEKDQHGALRTLVGSILKAHDHVGYGKAITTKVLASLVLHEEGIEPDALAVDNKKRALDKLAKGPLNGFIVSDAGTTNLWALPAEDVT